MSWTVGFALSVGVAVGVAGCASLGEGTAREKKLAAARLTQEELYQALSDFRDYFEIMVKQASAEIDEESQRSKTRRTTLLWRSRMIPACIKASKDDNPIQAMMDCWVLSVRMFQYFQEGEGALLFGDQQRLAIEASRLVVKDIERIASEIMTEEGLVEARDRVKEFARAEPIQGVFTRISHRMPSLESADEAYLTQIFSIPMAPFRAIGGVDRGAAAISDFTQVADRFADIVEDIPEATRWQAELFMFEMEEGGPVRSFMDSAASMAESSESLAKTADELPAALRKEFDAFLTELDEKQENLRATIEAVEGTLQQADAVVTSVDQAGASLADAGQAIEGASRAIGEMVQGIRHDAYPLRGDADVSATRPAPAEVATAPSAAKPAVQPSKETPPTTQPAAEDDDDKNGFDINDYGTTADSINVAATELQVLVAEIRELIESPRINELLADADDRVEGRVDQATLNVTGITNLAAWRVAQLLVFALILAVVYRAIASRLIARANRQSQG